jgi:sugar lactone lactonase YvrE
MGQDTVLATVPFDDSNGITFSQDYSILYVSNCGGHGSPHDGEFYKTPINDDGTAGEALCFAEIPIDSHMNGITMDECGNLYVVLSVGVIYRLSPDAEWEAVVDLRTGRDLSLAAIN